MRALSIMNHQLNHQRTIREPSARKPGFLQGFPRAPSSLSPLSSSLRSSFAGSASSGARGNSLRKKNTSLFFFRNGVQWCRVLRSSWEFIARLDMGDEVQTRDSEEVKAKLLAGLGNYPNLAALLSSPRKPAEAPVPAWPTHCARCCERCYPDLTQPWCGSCAHEFRAEYAPIFKSWVLRNRARYLSAARVPPLFQLCGFDTFEVRSKDQERAVRSVTQWCAGNSLGLFLHGTVGTGKTHVAVAALLEKLATRERCRFVAMRELILECRESFRQDTLLSQIIDRLTDGPDFLLLDDLGAEKPSEFVREALELLIDRAYVKQRPRVIVTSNLDLDALSRSIGERVADRLRELCVVVRLGGGSHRRRIAARRAGVGEGGSNL